MDNNTVQEILATLSPEIPWTHDHDLGFGIRTVDPSNEKFQRKAKSLSMIGTLLQEYLSYVVSQKSLKGLRAIDLACGEGGHSIALAQKGVDVIGVEGRDLYIQRAEFVAKVKGIKNIEFIKGDVREIEVAKLGKFDIVIASGILHHLSIDSFESFLKTLKELSQDIVFLYTHVGSELAVSNHRLSGPEKTVSGYEGYLFREHSDGASVEEKIKQVRASLDNTFSFWATPESLYKALQDLGFRYVTEIKHPHVFPYQQSTYRPIIVAKV